MKKRFNVIKHGELFEDFSPIICPECGAEIKEKANIKKTSNEIGGMVEITKTKYMYRCYACECIFEDRSKSCTTFDVNIFHCILVVFFGSMIGLVINALTIENELAYIALAIIWLISALILLFSAE
jgi:hypothetical protein